MFQGPNLITLDAKGRIAVPARHRDLLTQEGRDMRISLVRNPLGCLMLFARAVWDERAAQIAALPVEADVWKMMYLGYTQQTELDASGRVLVAPELRAVAGMTREVMMMGAGSHLQLWDPRALADIEREQAAKGMPESLRKITL
jgi:MraZ protein